MSHFPLYTTLMYNIPKKDLTIVQKNELIKKIVDMNPNEHELIYMLIKSYYVNNDNGDIFSIPYKAQLCKDKIDFDICEFPLSLRQLIYKFVVLHKKKLIEEHIFQKDN